MANIDKYLSAKSVTHFRKSIPRLLKETSSVPKGEHSNSYGVGGNTFRALRGLPQPPSKVYRSWARETLEKLSKKDVKSLINTRQKFLAWHKKLASSLNYIWRKEQGCSLSIAHKYKLIDLYIKWISKNQFFDDSTNELLVKRANCALDKQILQKLNKCYSDALPIGVQTMGNITSQHTYDFCQELIGDFAKAARGTRLLFDRYAYKRGNG